MQIIQVAWEALGLTNYLEIVKVPMDLGTIKKNLEKKKYKDFEAFKNDIMLVANNCKTYNARNSDVHKLVCEYIYIFNKINFI